jgi:hypothetical protein
MREYRYSSYKLFSPRRRARLASIRPIGTHVSPAIVVCQPLEEVAAFLT